MKTKTNKLLELIGSLDPEMDKLRVAYANAMWTWAAVEGEMLGIYIVALGAYDLRFKPLQQSFFAVVNAKSRLDMVNQAARAAWAADNALLTEWADLYKRCQAELARRGKIAHLEGRMVYPPSDTEDTAFAALMQHSWHPQYPADFAERKSKGIDTTKLIKMRDAWSGLALDLSKFARPLWQSHRERDRDPTTG